MFKMIAMTVLSVLFVTSSQATEIPHVETGVYEGELYKYEVPLNASCQVTIVRFDKTPGEGCFSLEWTAAPESKLIESRLSESNLTIELKTPVTRIDSQSHCEPISNIGDDPTKVWWLPSTDKNNPKDRYSMTFNASNEPYMVRHQWLFFLKKVDRNCRNLKKIR